MRVRMLSWRQWLNWGYKRSLGVDGSVGACSVGKETASCTGEVVSVLGAKNLCAYSGVRNRPAVTWCVPGVAAFDLYSLGMSLSGETLRYRALLEDKKKLRLERATLKQPERIRQEAAARCGMRVPAPTDVVEIQ